MFFKRNKGKVAANFPALTASMASQNIGASSAAHSLVTIVSVKNITKAMILNGFRAPFKTKKKHGGCKKSLVKDYEGKN